MAGRPRRVSPVSVTDHLLVDILDELRAMRSQLVQDVPAPQPQPDHGPVLVTEPAPVPAPDPALPVPPPPRHGKGSGRDAWADYARGLGIDVTLDARQRDIVAAVDAWREEDGS